MDKNTKILISFGSIAVIALLVIIYLISRDISPAVNPPVDIPPSAQADSAMKSFSSIQEFREKVESVMKNSGGNRFEEMAFSPVPFGLSQKSSLLSGTAELDTSAPAEYSQTNVQVQGVDEADIVKTDGQYVYVVTRNFITISKSLPAEEASLVSKIELKDSKPQEVFIEDNNLLVFGSRSYVTSSDYYRKRSVSPEEVYPYPTSVSFVEIYDTADKSNPKLKRKIEFDGSYKTARKIGSDVYFVLNHYPAYYLTEKEVTDEVFCSAFSPQYREGLDINKDTAMKPISDCLSIRYIEPIRRTEMSTIIGISIDNHEKSINKETILGAGENVYASENNIYLVKTDYIRRSAFLQEVLPSENKENTQIYKLSIEKGKIDFKDSGEVPGRVLNQFSMDEFDGYFRIATTQGRVSRAGNDSSSNNIYILDENLKQVGAIEDIAPGEQIYSARFMGKRGFLVTFKKIDPFFTLDLSNPREPKLIGKLKIPGYSDYLHPYDENHIIGIGKNTVEASETLSGTANFAWYQGIKMAIFDVSDFSNPKEMFKVEIGDRGTDSPILNDHKALLFSKDKNLLVIPVLEAQLTPEQKRQNREGNTHGDYVYQGAYVFRIDLENGFNLRGRVTHFDDEEVFKKSGYYFGTQDNSVKRSLYINDNLYTVSDAKIRINKLEDLSAVKDINFDLPKKNEDPILYYE